MSTTFTPTPKFNVNFYLALPCNMLDTRSDGLPVTVTVPADTVFPTDLSELIKEIKRVVSFDEIVGKNSDGETVCTNEGCGGFSSSSSITYSLKVFYPPRTTYLYEYKPKIALVRYIPVMLTTRPPFMNTSNQPINVLSENDFAVFRLTYNMRDFADQTSFMKLYASIAENQGYLAMLNESKFIEHNLGSLQLIQKVSKLSLGSLAPIKRSELKKLLTSGTHKPGKLTARPGAKGPQVQGVLGMEGSGMNFSNTPRPVSGTPRPVQFQLGGKQVGGGSSSSKSFGFTRK